MRKLFSKMDIPLFVLTILFSILGLIMIYSSSSVSAIIRYGVPTYYFFVKQAIFIGGAFIIGFLIILRLPTRSYTVISWPAMIAVIVALSLIFVKGKLTGQVTSWYDLGFFSLQPSEFAKSVLIVFSACIYNGLHYRKVKNIYIYLIPLGVGAICAGLIMMQPDLGSAVIVGGIVFLTFISIPMVKHNLLRVIKIMGIGAVIAVVVLLYSGQEILNSMQMDRLKFKNPCSRYTEVTGYQVCNGFIAINNGGVFGVGLGKSTQKYLYLPESHTDFIFPIIVEELGLVTGVLIILGYMYMLYRILKIAKESETLRCSVLAYGTFWYLTLHILINLLGILALIPLTGVPLPFLSYGGSFTINILVMLFVVQRVSIENKINRTKREIKAL
ncbi:MAG: FtsW/RodA/SpoVE family cell cycle protein [Bacilli bacterium]|nr:FtsW/RodA/SpoVE family cell cycle protein [Bacilli bacterium]